jgi:hypothetical protein
MRVARQRPNVPLNDLEPPGSARDTNHVDRHRDHLARETPCIVCHSCGYPIAVDSDTVYLYGISPAACDLALQPSRSAVTAC